ncbi:hypothetical protein BGZ83_001721 [Gryganskiella cystojenkinii]|nr:hypothetical protein BGZ83_001721 [Gryganskiella cystojenkinii]
MAMGDKNFHVPLPETGRVIDLGCGPATWTMDMATEMASVNFVGVDISPIYPTAIHPRNCNFYKEDFVQGVSQPDRMFDLAYQRNVCGGFTFEDWQKVMREAFRILKPGGWYECVESDVTIHDAGPKTQIVFDQLRLSMATRAVDPSIVRSLDQIMTATGFTNVLVKTYKVPVGSWSEDVSQRKVGQLWKENMFHILHTARPFLARAARISEAEAHEFVTAMEQETVNYKAYQVASTPAEEIKAVQITSTNIPYLKSLVWALIQSKDPVAINKSFTYTLDPFTVIEPSEKFKVFSSPSTTGTTPSGRHRRSSDSNKGPIMKLTTSKPLGLKNEQRFQVKVDVVADHGKSWLRINAGSAWSLVHEFAGMEDDSDDEQESDSESNDDDDHASNGITGSQHERKQRRIGKPIHVSKDTHADMVLLTRSLVLAADQNRLHYIHRPEVTLRFAGISSEEENLALSEMIQKSVRIGKKALSLDNGEIHDFSVPVIFGSLAPEQVHLQQEEAGDCCNNNDDDEDGNCIVAAAGTGCLELIKSAAAVISTTPQDPHFAPSFSIPMVVDDMGLFSETLNLDITTLMALSSFLCHTIRPDPGLFTSPPLILQAQQEHDGPLLPLLAKVFLSASGSGRQRRLVMTRVAATRFRSILKVIGGPEEQWRGEVLIHDPQEGSYDQLMSKEDLEKKSRRIRERWVRGSDWARQYGLFQDGPPRIEIIEDIPQEEEDDHNDSVCDEGNDFEDDSTVIEDDNDLSSLTSSTLTTATMRMRKRKELNMTELHCKIFLSGYETRRTTITANMVGFRTVTRNGLVPKEISVWFHSPRSLAEAKLPKDFVVKGGEEGSK